MYRALFCLLALTPAIALAAAHDSTGSPGDGSRTHNGSEIREGGLVQRFVVPHVRSAAFATGIGGRVTTVISATNGGAVPCDVAIDFYFAFNADTMPECTVNLTLAPLLAPGSDTANVCSRAIPGDRWTLCTATCNPALTFMQGKAVVRAGESCAADLALDARLYHSDTSDDVIAISEMETASDFDGDGIYDPNDNCSAIANSDQRDTNDDGIGNRCDPDLNNDCMINFADLQIMKSVFFSATDDADLNGDGLANFADLQIMKQFFFGLPGPSDLLNLCL